MSLEAFLRELPGGVDAPGDGDPIPRTMGASELRDTPTLILIDRNGFLRYHAFGQAPDLAVGAAIRAVVGGGDGLAVCRGRCCKIRGFPSIRELF